MNKIKVKKYGCPIPKDAEATPWDKIFSDLVRPYIILMNGIRTSYANASQ
jgi:hypothetical protein